MSDLLLKIIDCERENLLRTPEKETRREGTITEKEMTTDAERENRERERNTVSIEEGLR